MNNYSYISITDSGSSFSPNEDLKKLSSITIDSMVVGQFRIFYSDNIKLYRSNDRYCFILGDIYGYKDSKDIFDTFEKNARSREFDGFFTLIFVDPNSINIITDQSCLFPLYYHKKKLLISTIVYEIGKFVHAKPDTDELNYYTATKRTLPGNTIYENIGALKSETIFTYTNHEFHESRYIDSTDFIDKDYNIHEISQKLKSIVINGYKYLQQNNHNRILCDLSGGTDSRLTTLLAFHVFKKIKLFTKGTAKEIRISQKISQRCLNNSEYFKRNATNGNVDSNLIKFVAGHKDINYLKKKYIVNKHECMSFDAKITGENGSIFKDFWIRHLLYKPILKKTGISEKYLDMIIRTKILMQNPVLKSYSETKEYIKGNMKSNIDLKSRVDKILDQIAMKYSSNQNEYVSRQFGDLFYKIWSPFHSNRFILFCRNIHPKHRFLENIHSHIIQSVDRTCSGIVTDRSVFGFFPFKLVPKTKFNRFYYLFWDFLYDIQQFTIKLKKISQLNKKSPETDSENHIKIHPSLAYTVPELTKVKDKVLIETLNRWFDYLDY